MTTEAAEGGRLGGNDCCNGEFEYEYEYDYDHEYKCMEATRHPGTWLPLHAHCIITKGSNEKQKKK